MASVDQASDLNRREWGLGGALADPPVEFAIAPSSGTVRAQGVLDVKVRFRRCSATHTLSETEGRWRYIYFTFFLLFSEGKMSFLLVLKVHFVPDFKLVETFLF